MGPDIIEKSKKKLYDRMINEKLTKRSAESIKQDLVKILNDELELKKEMPRLKNFKDISGENLKKLQSTCKSYIKEVFKGESEDSDTPHYIFECAMTTFYGEDVWGWIRENS